MPLLTNSGIAPFRRFVTSSFAAAAVLVYAVPAIAVTPVSPCDPTLTSPDAIACAGYYEGNAFGGDAAKIALQQAAIASLPGSFTFDGNWGAVDATKITSLSNVNQLNFGQTLYGQTIIGAHFGNVAGPAGNVSVFWLFDFGANGANYVSLDNTQGFSNSVLYTTGSGVPEPSTWAMMLIGFLALGAMLRRRRLQEIGAHQFCAV